MKTVSNHFIACDAEFADSDIAIIGVPYDGTCSFRPGSRFAPNAIREVSDGIETYSPYQDTDLEDSSISDIGDVELSFGNRESALAEIKSVAEEVVSASKKLFSIGGEHLVTLPLFEAVHSKYDDVCLIHFDAHADMRDDYLGEKLSHATVVRRISEIIGYDRVFQFGIRSGTKDEFALMRENGTITCSLKDAKDTIGSRPVYLTVDLDVLDPSIFPGTGTPEPGGYTYSELLEKLIFFKDLNVVAADAVELAPHYDNSGVSTITAAGIIREILLILSMK